jgi:hypothetical protein
MPGGSHSSSRQAEAGRLLDGSRHRPVTAPLVASAHDWNWPVGFGEWDTQMRTLFD